MESKALCLVPGRGLASLPAGPAQRPAPTSRPAAACASPQTTLEVAPVSVCRPRGPGPLWGLLSATALLTWPRTVLPMSPCWALPAQTFRLTRARPWLSPGGPGLCVCVCVCVCKAQLKTSKAPWPKGCQRSPPIPVWSQSTPTDLSQHLISASATET